MFDDEGSLGRITHLLVDHRTDRAEWAIVEDGKGMHRALPVRLLDPFTADDVEELLEEKPRLRIKLKRADIRGICVVDAPEKLPRHRVRASVNGVAVGLSSRVGATVASPVSTDFDVVSLVAAAAFPTLGVDASPHDAAPPDTDGAATAPSRGGWWSNRWSMVRGGGGHVAEPPPPTAAAPEVGPAPTRRELVAELPKSVAQDGWFSVEVSVTQTELRAAPQGAPLDIPGGVSVTVVAAVPGSFEVRGDLTCDIAVPETGSSAPVLFTLRPRAVGSFPLRFTAYRGGTYLGRLEVEVAVGQSTSATTRESLGALDVTDSVNGEASLDIMYDRSTNTFRFLFKTDSRSVWSDSQVIEGDIRERIETLIPRFDSYARASSGLAPEAAMQRMKDEGFQLWDGMVPAQIKEAIWDGLGDITQMSIFSDREVVPWELLYLLDDHGNEPGFLIEQFPVTRWVMGPERRRRLTLDRPTFVVPDDAPEQAFDEVDDIRSRLGSAEAPILRDRTILMEALNDPSFDCLHFACHNEYDTERGSYVNFVDGDFRPLDMARLRKKRRLVPTRPLVFLNACRTQGSNPTYTSLDNWAGAFLDAGAGAVIGTSWAVRDSTARLFADTVYEQLRGSRNLGDSVREARQRASAELGDSTWLAYAVYGDPRATAATASTGVPA